LHLNLKGYFREVFWYLETVQMKIKNLFSILFCMVLIIACNDDDDPGDVDFVERDRGEQQIVDNDSLLEYLNTHYYNSDFLASEPNLGTNDIVITQAELDGNGNPIVPEGHTLLIESEDLETIVDPNLFEDTEYTYYILNLNQGGGEPQPSFTDEVRIVYEGFEQDGEVFDFVITPEDLPMVTAGGGGVIEGWRRVIPRFRPAQNFVGNGDGTTSYNNYGFGVMFLPSGLCYYSRQQGAIAPYSNLIFKFELYQANTIDHDNDLIESDREDLDNNLSVFDDDTDEDGLPNYIDVDDDGDGVLTRNEDIDGDGDPTNDIGVNGIPKYLDPEETESNEDNE
jgi:FKBP-type peptidyl-prolyl cis-trans isomerase FkpA